MPTSLRCRRPAWVRVVAGVSRADASGVLVFVASGALLPVPPPLLALASYMGPFLFAPLGVLLPLGALGRSRTAIIGLLVVLALFAALYAPLFLPRLGRAPEGRPLVAMTFNLGAERAEPGKIVAAIAGEDAGIVAVQEVTPEVAGVLRERLGGRYGEMVLAPELPGPGLLSRYPLVAREWFRPGKSGRVALQAALDVEGRRLQVIVAHPEPPDFARPAGLSVGRLSAEVVEVAARAAGSAGPVLALGDFNMGDLSWAYRQMAAALGDAYRTPAIAIYPTLTDEYRYWQGG